MGPKKGTSPEPTDAPEATTTNLEGFGDGGDEGPPDAACHSGLAFGDLVKSVGRSDCSKKDDYFFFSKICIL